MFFIENILLVDTLKHNLFSISQLYYSCYHIKFDYSKCLIEDATSKGVMFIGRRNKNAYVINIEFESGENIYQV